jgi:uncharacterized membrane protein
MSVYQLGLLLLLALLLAAALFLLWRSWRSVAAAGRSADYQLFGAGVRDDDRYWLLGGLLYSNPDDPALFVVNRWGFGISPNLAQPLGVRIAIGILVALALIPIALMLLSPGLGAAGQGCHPLSGCH